MASLSFPREYSMPLYNSQNMKSPNINLPIAGRSMSVPNLPPKPTHFAGGNMYSTSPYMYSSYDSPYSSYGNFSMPYTSSLYNTYNSSYGNHYNYSPLDYPGYLKDDHERRFIQFAEESSRRTFANVENIVRAFNSLAMMLNNTFLTITSSFRAVLGVAENFGRLRSMFGHIWYSVNLFRFINWMYRRLRLMLGLKVGQNENSLAWREAINQKGDGGSVSSWPTLAFLGVMISAPYVISRFLPKYEDKLDPVNWQSNGILAKVCYDFAASSQNELSINKNDNILLAPTHIQEQLNLRNTGWAYATNNGKSGLIPINYIIVNKKTTQPENTITPIPSKGLIKEESVNNNTKTHNKKVSFGDIEIFETDHNSVERKSLSEIDKEEEQQKQSND